MVNKKLKTILKTMIFLFVVVGLSVVSGATSDMIGNVSESNKVLFVNTSDCPVEYIEYVQENLERFVLSIETSELPECGDITVGTPFSFGNPKADIYYFPILCDNQIIYTLRVFPLNNGEYGGILGKAYVGTLNSMVQKTSVETPLTLMMEENLVVAYIGSEREVVYEYPVDMVAENSVIKDDVYSTEKMTSSVVDIMQENAAVSLSLSVEEILEEHALASYNSRSTPTSKTLATSITEQQGSLPWCAAYSTAMIVRFLKNDDTAALDVMEFHYDNPTEEDEIGESKVVEYACSRGIYPTYIKSTLNDNTLIDQIVDDLPVYLRMYRIKENGDKSYHAIVLRGYNLRTETWSIWNPWEDYYETFEMGGTYVPAGASTREYIYFQTVYDWYA